jgi:type I restriction enzyme S subunit
LPWYSFANKQDIIPNDAVVMTIIGATPEIVGRVAIVRANDPECVTNQNVAVISTNEYFDPYFITAYFQTKWGRDQIWRHARRTEQVNLNCREVERFLVPNPAAPFQETIGNLVRRSFDNRDRSIELYQEAHKILEHKLGMDRLTFQKSAGYTAQFSELETARRSDAEFFHVQYEPFLVAVRDYQHGWQPLRNLTRQTLPNFDSRKRFGDFDYIEIGDISVSNGNYSTNRINANELPANAKIAVSGGEILISQVRPTRGAITIVNDELNHATICSGAFYVCSAIEPSRREIIWLYLRCMKNVFEKYCGGTSYPTIDSRYIAKFPVPLFDDALAIKIRQLVMQSKSAMQESLQLLEKAKIGVEQLIEGAAQS